MKHRRVGLGRAGVVNTDGHIVGLDVGATSVRAAVLAAKTVDGRPTVTIEGVATAPLPPGTVVNGVVTDEAALTHTLKQLWHTHRFRCHRVILGVASQQVLVRDLEMPQLAPPQLAKALPFKAKEIVALPMHEVVLDFAPLGAPNSESGEQPGLLIATPRQPAVALVNSVERAGLKVARVDLSSFAALRASASTDAAIEAVIDIGAHLTTIVIHDHGVPRLVRTLPHGGQEMTEQLAKRVGLELDQAEQAKRTIGLTGPDPKAAEALAAAVRPLLSEIRSSINYFSSGNEGVRLQHISLTGGASLLPGLAETMAEQTGVPTRVVDPTQHVLNHQPSAALTADGPSAVAIGLAMGAAA